MTADDLVRGVVRIWSEGEASEVVGTGVLVAPGLVLTCAHVAARAWGEAPELEDGRGRTLRIDLPATAPHAWHEATVVHWLARRPAAAGAYDLAGLRFDAAARGSGVPLPLVDDEAPWGKQVRAFGFPAGRPDGSYASGVLRDVLANGWVLVKGGAEAREFTRPGYSGGPVTTDEGVVGLLTEGDSDVRVREALMVPVRAILGAWPELQHIVARSPYPGLASFTADDAPHFRGRAHAVAEIAHAVATPPHLVVLAGPSGSGKSSLIGAGVLPTLAAGHGPDGRSWRTLVWSPGAAPFATLARGLLRAAYGAADDTRVAVDAARLAHDLEAGTVALADVLGQDEDARWAIVVDQPEALLLEGSSEAGHASRSQRLFDALMRALDDEPLKGRIAVLVAVRTDFLDELLRQPALARHVRDDVVRYLGPVDDLREVIEGPLRDSGLARLEPGLTDRLLMAVDDVPNPLPLLQFTLAELWRKRRAGRLTHEAYDELGGVRQALANQAERLVGAFPADDLATVRDVLLQLGRPGAGDTVARRAARFEELGDRGRRVVTRLADARLVITDRDAEGVERIEVVHEALFEHWPRLRTWWREAADFRRWQEGLRFAVRVWHDEGQHPSDLLQGPRLRAAEDHLRDHPDAFGQEELAYVLRSSAHEKETDEASRRRMQRELRVRRRMNLLLGVGMAAALALAVTTAWQTAAVRRSRAEVETLLQATTAANVALGQLTNELELSLGTSRAILARQLGIQAVAIANDPSTFGSGMRRAALLAAYAARLDPGPSSQDHLLRTLLAQPTYRATLADDATAVALDPKGRLLAVGDARGGVRLVDAVDGASVGGRMEGHTGSVAALAFGGDGTDLVSGGADGRLVAWSTAPFRRRAAFPAQHAGPVAAVAITSDGGTWLSTDLTGSLRSWDADSRAPLATFARYAPTSAEPEPVAASIPVLTSAVDGRDPHAAAGHRAWSAAIATHPELALVAVAVPSGVAMLDATTLEPEWLPTTGGGDTAGVAFSADGSALVTVSETGTVRHWDLDTEAEPARWASGVAGVRALAPGRTADRVLIGTAHGAAVWFDLATGRPYEAPLRGHGTDVNALAVGADLVVTASKDGRVVTWDRSPRNGLGVSLGTSGRAPHGIAIDDAGEHAYVGSQDGTLTRLSLTDPAASTTVLHAHDGGVNGAAFAQGRLATIGRDGRLVVRDPATLEPLATPFVHDDPLWSITFDPHGTAWIVGGVRGIVARVPWDATGPGDVLRRPSRRWAPGAVVARADDSTWAIALEHEIELWRGDTVLGRVEQIDGAAVSTLTFDPSGTHLLASSGSLVTLFSVPSLEIVASWPDARIGVYAPDGGLLALGDADGGVRLLDGRTLATIGLPFRGHASPPMRLAFTSDGRWLVTADEVGDVLMWPTHAEAWLDRACEVAWQDLGADEITALLGEHDFEPPCEDDRG